MVFCRMSRPDGVPPTHDLGDEQGEYQADQRQAGQAECLECEIGQPLEQHHHRQVDSTEYGREQDVQHGGQDDTAGTARQDQGGNRCWRAEQECHGEYLVGIGVAGKPMGANGHHQPGNQHEPQDDTTRVQQRILRIAFRWFEGGPCQTDGRCQQQCQQPARGYPVFGPQVVDAQAEHGGNREQHRVLHHDPFPQAIAARRFAADIVV